ncbi:hypothetical protein [Rubritalea tangerina]|uniref:hypothetical protein n=1 Tax=Rubritalea tangerina TaxID=430798 RepID=UPI003617A181
MECTLSTGAIFLNKISNVWHPSVRILSQRNILTDFPHTSLYILYLQHTQQDESYTHLSPHTHPNSIYFDGCRH